METLLFVVIFVLFLVVIGGLWFLAALGRRMEQRLTGYPVVGAPRIVERSTRRKPKIPREPVDEGQSSKTTGPLI